MANVTKRKAALLLHVARRAQPSAGPDRSTCSPEAEWVVFSCGGIQWAFQTGTPVRCGPCPGITAFTRAKDACANLARSRASRKTIAA
eukprot:2816450-Pyramimonas_sp.AAC.1